MRTRQGDKKKDETIPKISKDKVSKKTKETEPAVNTEKSKVLNVGDDLPPIVLQNQDNESVDLSQVEKFVVFFYPKANTPGCTNQACQFRDDYEKFKELGYSVFGCSADSPKSLKNWSDKHNFQYALLSDPKFQLIGAVGAKNGTKITRSHVIFKDNKLVEAQIKVSAKESSPKALEFISS